MFNKVDDTTPSADLEEFIMLIWATPAGFVIVQIILMLTMFRWDTPLELAKNGENDRLYTLMQKLYKTDREVKKRIKQIKKVRRNEAEDQVEGVVSDLRSNSSEDEITVLNQTNMTYWKLLTDP
jgi:hypothetical protein